MVTIVSPSRYKLNRRGLKKFVSDLLAQKGYGDNHSLNIIFAGKTKLRQIANTYKKEDMALPVLSFVYNEQSDDKNYLGEIFICYPYAVIMAANKNKTVDHTIEKLVEHGLDNILKNI